MNQTFILSQLRAAVLAIIAFAAGKGWLTPTDATFATAMVTTLGPVLVPFLMSGYANYGVKKIPQEAVGIVPSDPMDKHAADNSIANGTNGEPVNLAGKIVGALLLGVLVLGALPSGAFAQSVSCDPLVIFKGVTPQNFLARIKACGDDDIKAAMDDASAAPVDNAALACLVPVQKFKTALANGGLLTAFQGFRRAKQAGLITGCTNYVNSTIGIN